MSEQGSAAPDAVRLAELVGRALEQLRLAGREDDNLCDAEACSDIARDLMNVVAPKGTAARAAYDLCDHLLRAAFSEDGYYAEDLPEAEELAAALRTQAAARQEPLLVEEEPLIRDLQQVIPAAAVNDVVATFQKHIRIARAAAVRQEPDGMPRGLRPVVAGFALAMEAKLRKHDAKRGRAGWEGDSDDSLFRRLMEEEHELQRALEGRACGCRSAGECGHLPNWTAIRDEAADVANFAMMLADNHGALEGMKKVAETLATPAPVTQPDTKYRDELLEAQAFHAVLEVRRRLRGEAARCMKLSKEVADAWAQAGDEIMAVAARLDAHMETFRRVLSHDTAPQDYGQRAQFLRAMEDAQ